MVDVTTKYLNILEAEKKEIEQKINNFINNSKLDIVELNELEKKLNSINEKINLINQENVENNFNTDFKKLLTTLTELVKSKQAEREQKEYAEILKFLDTISTEETKNFQTLIFNLFFSEFVTNGLNKTISKDQIKIYEDREKLKNLYNALNSDLLNINTPFYLIYDLDEPKTELCYLIGKQKIKDEFIIKVCDYEQKIKSLRIKNINNPLQCIIVDNKKTSNQIINQYKI